MRAVVMVALATLGVTTSLRAQHGTAYEFGLFGSYTRYDPAFGLPNRIGGGVRLGYLFGDVVQAEAEILFPSEYTVGVARATIDPLIGSVSLVFNILHSQRNILYLLGGYSRLDFGTRAPFQFSDNAVHAAIGDRIFLSRNIALRLEGRGIYVPSTQSAFGKTSVTHIVGTVGLSVFAPSRQRAPAAPPPSPPPVPAPVAAAPAAPPLPTPPRLVQDADQDRVPDRSDACPNTPLGGTVDARGCSLDGDRDGVADGLDRCPDTPAGGIVDPTGCTSDVDRDDVPDADGDGVRDSLDRCPNTPRGTPVDGGGCSNAPDSDNDGVPNPADKCAGTPKGVPVDATGCMTLFQPEAAPPAPGSPARPSAPTRPTLILRGVNFQTGKSLLTTSSYVALDQVAASLLANPDIRIEIAGYTDNTGPAGVNIRLSQARAAAVRAYLARKGVSPARMLARGYGSRSPIASNTAAAGRTLNRRVELHKLP